jgi:hypothetical protein
MDDAAPNIFQWSNSMTCRELSASFATIGH